MWYWLFVPDTPLLVASRKEQYVDQRGSPDTLFWKFRYLLGRLPRWMRPEHRDTNMELLSLDNGSIINGESTNADLARGGRRKAILLDEFAAVDNGREILASSGDATPCRIFNSTPQGRGSAFADVRFSGKVKVVTLHWSDHPVKGRGKRFVEVTEGKKAWTSPWYVKECARRTSRKEIAQELDIDYLASGEMFFDSDVLSRIRASGELREPEHRGELLFEAAKLEAADAYRLGPITWSEGGGRRRLSLWCELQEHDGVLRPPQDDHYVAFADVSHGQGASNSALVVASIARREMVGHFVCPDTPPHDLAHYAVAICKWFGGASKPTYLGWEANGPGGIMGSEVVKLGWIFYYHTRDEAVEHRPESKPMGWHSTKAGKQIFLSNLRRALARGEFTIHDEALLAELEQYIYYPSGSIGPSSMVEETEGARAAHGDRVIAAAGAVMLMADQPRAVAPEPPIPVGSFADRRQLFQKSKQKRGDGW